MRKDVEDVVVIVFATFVILGYLFALSWFVVEIISWFGTDLELWQGFVIAVIANAIIGGRS